MNETEIAWLAGLFDGEGYIGIERGKDGVLSVRAQVIMTHERTIDRAEAAVKALGVGKVWREKRHRNADHKPTYTLRMGRQEDVAIVASAMIGHSITKCLQWELAAEFCASRQARDGVRDPYTEREQAIFRELANLNRKGPAHVAPGGEGQHPVESIVWLPADSLRHNYWNPNHVMTQELRLLERSLLRTNWVQPILINPDNLIIDGFHRVQLAKESEPIRRRDGGLVPCAVLDVPEPEAMMITVRMNRAKGTHAAFRMSALVRALIDQHHYDPQQIATEIGATRAEVDLLYQEDVFAARKIPDYRYSQAWVPEETTRRK